MDHLTEGPIRSSNTTHVRHPHPKDSIGWDKRLDHLNFVSDFGQLLSEIFPGKDDLNLLEIGSNNTDFVNHLSQLHPNRFAHLIATDILSIDSSSSGPHVSSAILNAIDWKDQYGHPYEQNFDIAVFNAPILKDDRQFGFTGIHNAISRINRPGLIIVRVTLSDDQYHLSFKNPFMVDSKYPEIRYQKLSGLPPTDFIPESSEVTAIFVS